MVNKFTGKVYCSKCMTSMKYKRERNTQKIICSVYDNKGAGSCERKIIEEDWILDKFVRRLFVDERTPENIELLIRDLKYIVFDSKSRIEFIFKNPKLGKMMFDEGSFDYGNNVRVVELGWVTEGG